MTDPNDAITIEFRCSREEWSLIRNNAVTALDYDEVGELVEYLTLKIDTALKEKKGMFDR